MEAIEIIGYVLFFFFGGVAVLFALAAALEVLFWRPLRQEVIDNDIFLSRLFENRAKKQRVGTVMEEDAKLKFRWKGSVLELVNGQAVPPQDKDTWLDGWGWGHMWYDGEVTAMYGTRSVFGKQDEFFITLDAAKEYLEFMVESSWEQND